MYRITYLKMKLQAQQIREVIETKRQKFLIPPCGEHSSDFRKFSLYPIKGPHVEP